jgi:plastocyanin
MKIFTLTIVAVTTVILLVTQVLQITNNYASATTSSTVVQSGEATTPLAVFSPQTVEINAGGSVTWTNPTRVAEPHTATFFLDNSTNAGIVSPLAVSNTTRFLTMPPGSNNEPILLTDNKTGMSTIIAVNARTYNPTAIDSRGAVNFMKLNSNYSMSGTEKYVNSGWILPEGLEQQYPGSGNTFTITFEKPGTYDYLCVIHPWMTGSVRVG